MEEFNAKQILETIENGDHIPEKIYIQIMEKVKEILFHENNYIFVNVPIIVIGDIHGQLFDMLQVFTKICPISQSDMNYLFLGDFVDRGYHSLETFAYLATLKIMYPTRIFLLRGNHETRAVNSFYGFYKNCIEVYGNPAIWELSNLVFDLLPLAAPFSNLSYSFIV